LFVFQNIKKKHSGRRVYTKSQLLLNQETQKVPDDWKPVPEVKELEKKDLKNIETFILKEIENSVKELKTKRTPFAMIDLNVVANQLNPDVSEFRPKPRLNPHAEDFKPSW
jgi:hypothetical protein